MLPEGLEPEYGAADVERLLLARRRLEVVYPELGPCWVWTGSKTTQGYGRLQLARRRYSVHRLAATLWLGLQQDSRLIVCHACDNPPCYKPDHLSLGTQADNMRDAIAKGRHMPPHLRSGAVFPSGEDNGNAKLTTAEVLEIRKLYAVGGITQAALAARFGVSQKLISLILNGRLWRSVPTAAEAA